MKPRRLTGCAVFILSLSGVLAAAAADSPSDPQALWAALTHPRFDPERIASVQSLIVERDLARLTFREGTLGFAQPVEGRVLFAVFRGRGVVSLGPRLPLEVQQLRFHSGQEALEEEFSEAVLFFSDTTFEEILKQVPFSGGDVSGLEKLHASRTNKLTEYGLNWEPRLLKSVLAEDSAPHALFVAELKTRRYDWLTLIVDQADPEQVELAQFDDGRRTRTIWSKFPSGGRRPEEAFADPMAHHEYRLAHYTLDVAVKSNAELTGQAEVALTLQRDGERVLLLALDPNLRVAEVLSAAGEPLTFFQPEDPKDRVFFGDFLAVVSPQPFPRGINRIRFRYGGKRVVRKEGRGTYFCQSYGWYPTYGLGRDSIGTNEFALRADFDLTLRVPKKYQAVAVGTKVEEREEGDSQVTRWQSELPLAVAGFAFGDYKLQTEAVGNIQVEVYANRQADDFFQSIEIGARGDWLPTESGPKAAPATLGSLAPARMAKVMAAEVANSLRLFEKYFGPYPYKKLAVSNIPYSYGQGWPSLLYISSLSFLDSTQRHQLGVQDHVRLTDAFRAHETSHQWWGHAVGWKSYHDQWLSEGFAEFSGMLYTLYRRSPEEYLQLLRKSREELQVRDQEGAIPEQIGPLTAGLRLSSARHPAGYAVVVYSKGAWVLHMLRMMLFDARNPADPDARFIALLQEFTRTFHNQPASTEDFKRIVEKHMLPTMDLDGNGRMDWFFDSWVHGTGIPHYILHYSIEPGPAPEQYVLRGTLRQRQVPESFRSMVPVYFHQGKNMFRAGWLTARGSETPFQVTLGFKPDKVTLNQSEEVLCVVE